jgi:hypothetical protein
MLEYEDEEPPEMPMALVALAHVLFGKPVSTPAFAGAGFFRDMRLRLTADR